MSSLMFTRYSIVQMACALRSLAVNTTKRIESKSEAGMILMSDKTLSALGNRVQVVRKLQVELKGLEGTRDLFQIAWSDE